MIKYRLNRHSENKQDLPGDFLQINQTDQMAMKRAKPQRSNVVKFLEEIGYEDIFDTAEVKEIKDMFSKNPANMTKNELVLDSIHKFDPEGDEEIKENLEETQSQNGNNAANVNETQISDNQTKQTLVNKRFQSGSTYHLKSHFDAVRDGQFIPNMDVAVTVSEDCTIKLWDLQNINQEEKQLTQDIKYNFIDDFSEYAGDPNSFYSYYTLRGHTGIITKVATEPHREVEGSHEPMFYSAGIEGVVRVWKVPSPSEINQFGED